MVAGLMSLALMTAALLFVIALPFGDSDAARALRRAAGAALALAFVPPILAGIAQSLFHDPRSPAESIGCVFAGCGAIAGLIMLSFASYGLLELRKRFSSRQPAPHDQFRYVKRRPHEILHAEREEHDEDHEDWS
jgi:hypothetical protein